MDRKKTTGVKYEDQKKMIGVKYEEQKKASEHITLKVMGDNATIQFKVKKYTPLKKIMDVYCKKAQLSMDTIRWRFDGEPIRGFDTPASLKLEEGDTIEVFQKQESGS